MPGAGDIEHRFLDLIDRNHGRITRLCRAWSRSQADLEDLRAEAYMQLWRSLPSHDGTAAEDTWVYRVVLNTVMLFGRSEARRRRRHEALKREAVPRQTFPAQSVEDHELLERISQALGQLEPADRALLALYLEELPHSGIAEVTGLSANHIGVRLHRIKKKFARMLGQGEGGDP